MLPNNGMVHDNVNGPCSCGATHVSKYEEIKQRCNSSLTGLNAVMEELSEVMGDALDERYQLRTDNKLLLKALESACNCLRGYGGDSTADPNYWLELAQSELENG